MTKVDAAKRLGVFMGRILGFLVMISCFLLSSLAYADDALKRVGGEFVVSDIKRMNSGMFEVTFASVLSEIKPSTLTLLSDHVHVRLEKGLKLRISAEIAEVKGDTAHLKQILLFMPPPAGENQTLPIWMLSSVYPTKSLKGARYIEMHAPTADYQVM